MRASRLVSVLLLLQARGRMTAHELAGELEVSVRTIYRDVASLHAAGVPLYGDAGPDGGYRLLDGYRTRLTGLTAGEAESLFLAGLPGPAADLGLGSVVAAARLKLMAALPAELRERASLIAERFHLDAPTWYHDADSTPHLAALADAVWNARTVRVRYRRWRAPQNVERSLDPYGLVLKAGTWYAVAAASGRVSTYRVSQILDLWPTDETFARSADFDLAAYWRSYLDEFETRLHQSEAVVLVSPEGLRQMAHHLGRTVAAAAARTGVPVRRRRSTWTRVTIPIESVEHAHGQLLRLGAEAEVLEPTELRDRLRETVQTLSALYAN